MESALALSLYLLMLLGSTALWITFLNRAHGLGVWRPLIHACSLLSLLGLCIGPFALAIGVTALLPQATSVLPAPLSRIFLACGVPPWGLLAECYAALCLVAVMPCAWWITSNWRYRAPSHLRQFRTENINLAAACPDRQLAHGVARWAAVLPGNEVFRLELNQLTLALDRLPASLAGLSIAQLSDLHMSGRIGIDYFHEVVDRTNALEPDLIVITGDLVDSATCLEWIPQTLGRLKARYGVFVILGNHDLCVDVEELRTILTRSGLTNLGGRSQRLEIAGQTILLCGNELPWLLPADLAAHELDLADGGESFRILLSHAPDQIRWARRRNFDLMLAGHTHGGQICFPVIGPVLAPSIFGTKYACGLFYETPTLMHVSRGTSGLTPVRYLCRPEISLLRLVPTRIDVRASDEESRAEEDLVKC